MDNQCSSCKAPFWDGISAEDKVMKGVCRGCAAHIHEMNGRQYEGSVRVNESHDPSAWTYRAR